MARPDEENAVKNFADAEREIERVGMEMRALGARLDDLNRQKIDAKKILTKSLNGKSRRVISCGAGQAILLLANIDGTANCELVSVE